MIDPRLTEPGRLMGYGSDINDSQSFWHLGILPSREAFVDGTDIVRLMWCRGVYHLVVEEVKARMREYRQLHRSAFRRHIPTLRRFSAQ